MKKKNNQPATLKDIALATGYSVNTVSRALRDKDDIGEETKKIIKEKAEEMGHINNMIASSLRLGFTKTIAVILGDISNPHFAVMTKEIEVHAREKGYSSFLINTNEDADIEHEAIRMALNKNVDGIIICPTQKNEDNVNFLLSTGIPFVLIGRHFENIDTNYVICNDELGGYQAVDHLLKKGHRDILMLSGPSYISSSKERTAGYRRAFQKNNILVNEELIKEVPVLSSGCTETMRSCLDSRLRFSAIFAFSDLLAWNAWSFLLSQGFHVPYDYSIVGFDNIQSKLDIPYRLTTISSYKTKMSILSVETLIQVITSDDPAAQYIHHSIDTSLVEGETVRQL